MAAVPEDLGWVARERGTEGGDLKGLGHAI